MKSLLYSQAVRKVRDEVNDLVRGNTDSRNAQASSSRSTGNPQYYHQSPANSSTVNPYSHTASSTAGYAQSNTYPKLPEQHSNREGKVFKKQRKLISISVLFFNFIHLEFNGKN